jgi:hypothetical protein
MTLLMKSQSASSNIFSFTSVFEWQVWLLLFITLFLVGFSIAITERLSPFSSINYEEGHIVNETQLHFDLNGMNNSFFLIFLIPNMVINVFFNLESLWFSMGSFMHSGAEDPPYTNSTRMLLFGFYLFTAIILSTYQANLSAVLTSNRASTSISTIEELADQTQIKFSFIESTVIESYFRNMKQIENDYEKFWTKANLLAVNLDLKCTSSMKTSPLCFNEHKGEDIFDSMRYHKYFEFPLKRTYSTLMKQVDNVGLLKSNQEGIRMVKQSTDKAPFAFITEIPTGVSLI